MKSISYSKKIQIFTLLHSIRQFLSLKVSTYFMKNLLLWNQDGLTFRIQFIERNEKGMTVWKHIKKKNKKIKKREIGRKSVSVFRIFITRTVCLTPATYMFRILFNILELKHLKLRKLLKQLKLRKLLQLLKLFKQLKLCMLLKFLKLVRLVK